MKDAHDQFLQGLVLIPILHIRAVIPATLIHHVPALLDLHHLDAEEDVEAHAKSEIVRPIVTVHLVATGNFRIKHQFNPTPF